MFQAGHNHFSCRIASASIVISTMLPTTTPPLSKVLFQLTELGTTEIEML